MNNTQTSSIVTAVCWSLSGTVGLIGNIVLIFIIFKDFKKCKPYEKIIFATLLTDLCMCFNSACLEPYVILSHGEVPCKIAGFFHISFMGMNQVWITINMFSRYLAIYHKEKYKAWFNVYGILACFILVLIVNMPVLIPLIYYDAFGLNNNGICAVKTISTMSTFSSLYSQIFLLISNVLCVAFGYLIVKKIRIHISQVGPWMDSGLVEESRQIIILLAISTVMPILVQCPANFVKLSQYFTAVNPWFSRVSMLFLPLNLASAPFITAFVIKPYRKKVVKLFSRGSKIITINVVEMNAVNH